MSATARVSALLLAGAALLAAPALLPAQVVVDDFATAQATLSDPPGGASTATTAGADILGLHRGLRVFNLGGPGPTSVGVAAGALTLTIAETTPDSRGEALLVWDGDLDPSSVDPTGLGGVDLTAAATQGGFRFGFDAARAGSWFVLTVYQDATHVSRAARALPAGISFFDVFVDFAELGAAPGAVGPASLTQVGAMTLRVGGVEGATPALVLSRVATAPPTLAALKVDRTPAGDPIPGSVQPGDQIRYRITISNSGAGADGVALTDVLDANLALVAGSVRTTPLARDDLYRTVTSTPLDSSAAGAPPLLANDSDPDGNALAAVPATGQATTQGGTVNVLANGHFLYTPAAGFQGVDSFPYTIAATAGDPTTDAAGNPIPPAVGRATVVIDRVAPVVTAGGTLAYDEDDPPTAIDPSITVADADSANLVSATAQVTGNYQNGEDLLSFVDTATITGVFVPATGLLTLTGSDTVAAYQAALRAVRYENGSDDPDTGDRTVTWIVSDGVESSAPVTSTIEVDSINDAPVLTAGGVLAYTENQAATAIDATITVADADHANLASASAQITGNYQNGQDLLACGAPCAGLSPTFVPATGTLTLSGSATLAVYQTALRGVTYFNNSENPSGLARTVTWLASDGIDTSAPVTSTIAVTPVNDPPIAADDAWDTIGNTQLVVDLPALATPHVRDTTPGAADGVRDNDTDPAEGNNHAVTAIVGCADVTPPFGDGPACATTQGGTVLMNANGTFVYTPDDGDTALSDTFTYTLTDDGLPTPASDNAVVTISLQQRVWYVRNDSAAGGLGRSADPFDTLVEAQTASAANDWIFVHFGNGATTGQNAGIALRAGQHLVGEHAGLSIPVNLNGNGSPAVLFAAVPGNRPLLDDTVAGTPEGVHAVDVIPVEIVGLNLAGNVNAIDWTTTAPFAGAGALSIRDNVVRAATNEGVDVNLVGTGATNLAFHDNTLTATGTAVDVQETGTGSLTITAFHDNVVTGTSAAAGIMINTAIFDATPGAAINPVPGGTTAIGTAGDRIGGAGLTLSGVTGALDFANLAAGTIGAGDLDIFTDSGAALTASGTGGFDLDVTANAGTLVANAGPAAVLSTLDADLRWSSLTSTNSSATGVSLTTVTGTFSAPTGSSITNATGTDFLISGGTAAVTYGGTITDDVGQLVSVSGATGGTKSFTGAITDGNDGDGGGISLSSNGGTTIRFAGGLLVSTGSNPALSATGGGNLEVCDENPCAPGSTGLLVNSLTTTTGTALNVANTAITANRLEFRSISANGAGSGIVLNATGSAGGLSVKGNGGACTIATPTCTGGSILNSTGAGVSLTSTSSVHFALMRVSGSADDGIRGTGVVDFEVSEGLISNNGNALGENGLDFAGLSGTAAITSSTVSNSHENNVLVRNTSGTLSSFEISASTFSGNDGTNGNDGVLIEAGGTASITTDVSGSSFSSHKGDHFQAAALNSGVLEVTFSSNTLSGGHPLALGQGVTINAATGVPGYLGSVTYDIVGNTINGAISNGVAVVQGTSAASASFTGSVRNNLIGTAGVVDSCSSQANGIYIDARGNGTHTSAVTGNVLRRCFDRGILAEAGDGDSVLNLTVTGNTIDQQIGVSTREAIQTNFGITSTNVFGNVDSNTVCLQLGGAGALENVFSHGGGAPDDFRLRKRFEATVRLPGYAGATDQSPAALAQVVAFIQGQNTGSAGEPGSAAASGAGGGYTGGATCPLP